MHIVAKQPLPGNIQALLVSQQSAWQQMTSTVQLRLQFHTKRLCVRGGDSDGVSGGDGDGISGEGGDIVGDGGGDGVDSDIFIGGCADGEMSDLCAVVMMGHVCRVLGECAEEAWWEEGEDGRSECSKGSVCACDMCYDTCTCVHNCTAVSLYIMAQWVGSSKLATPTQQHTAMEVSNAAYIYITHLVLSVAMVSTQMLSKLQNGVGNETCPVCQTCILPIPHPLSPRTGLYQVV